MRMTGCWLPPFSQAGTIKLAVPPSTLVRLYYLIAIKPPFPDATAPGYANEASSNTPALASGAQSHKSFARDPGHLPRGINTIITTTTTSPSKTNQFSKSVPRVCSLTVTPYLWMPFESRTL